MSHELVRALRPAYDDIDGGDTGQPGRAAIGTIWSSLQNHPDARHVTALWSAARALVFPQVGPDAVERCGQAIDAARGGLIRGVASILPPAVDALLQKAHAPGTSDPRQVDAQQCLGHALAFCVQPTPSRFMQVIDAMVVAQHSEFLHPARSKQAWIGWLDDVVSRSDRFSTATMLDLLERTLRGTLDMLPVSFEWEGVADSAGKLEVWVKDPKTRSLLMAVMATEPLRLAARGSMSQCSRSLILCAIPCE